MAAPVKFSEFSVTPAAQRYLAYGLRISCDRAIPGPIAIRSQGEDLNIHFDRPGRNLETRKHNQALWYESYIKDANGEPLLKIWKEKNGGSFSIEYSHGLAFHIDPTLSSVNVTGAQWINSTDFASFLLGPVLGILLRLKGLTCLHASAVAFNGKALLFAGAEGSGKSTAAAIFAKNGHGVLADDIVVLDRMDRTFSARPGYPALNLLSDSVRWLRGSDDALPEIETEKQRVMLDENALQFQREALPLGAIFILDAAEPAELNERLAPQKSLIALASATYANRMLDKEMRTAEFLTLGELANLVPVFRTSAHQRKAGFEAFYQTVCRAANAL